MVHSEVLKAKKIIEEPHHDKPFVHEDRPIVDHHEFPVHRELFIHDQPVVRHEQVSYEHPFAHREQPVVHHYQPLGVHPELPHH